MIGMSHPLRRILPRSFKASPDRTILVLQGQLALWTRWHAGQCVAEEATTLSRGEVGTLICPWSESDETLVDVIADSPLDEIERVLVEADAQASVGAVDARKRSGAPWARAMLRKRLQREYADAEVRSAPRPLTPLLATLWRRELPELWLRRLDVLQRGNVTVTSVHSALALTAPGYSSESGDVLHVSQGGGTERHVLVRSGEPVFTRVVSSSGGLTSDISTPGTVQETLDYLATSLRIKVDRVERLEGAMAPGGAEVPGAGGEEIHAAESSAAWRGDARRLAAMLGSSEGSWRRQRPTVQLAPLFDKQKRRLELRRLHAATALTAAIAGLTVFLSAVHGVESARQRARAVAAGEALSLRVEQLTRTAADLHAQPERAEASLALIERLDYRRAPEAEELLATLAGVMTSHPGIRLDRLEWSTPDVDRTVGDGQRVAARNEAFRSVPREEEEGQPGPIWLEIAGRVDAAGALSIRERQRRFEHFVGELERDERISRLGVQLSPAAAAVAGGETEFSARSADYVVQLQFGASS